MKEFEEVARNYEPLIRNTIKQLRLYKNIEDMHQIGLIALWEAYEKFDPAKGEFPAYAKATVKGRMLTALKKAKVYDERHVFPKPVEEGEDYFSVIPNSTEAVPLEKETLSLYLHNLSDRQRFWVEESLFLGKKTREIAEEQGVSQHTVRSWKKEAVKKIKHNVGNIE